MARHGEVERQMDSQVSTQLVFEYLSGMGEEGTQFVVRKMASANPNPREDLREFFVYYLSAFYILRVDFQCEMFLLLVSFFWYRCCFLIIHGDAIDDIVWWLRGLQLAVHLSNNLLIEAVGQIHKPSLVLNLGSVYFVLCFDQIEYWIEAVAQCSCMLNLIECLHIICEIFVKFHSVQK